MSTPRSLLLSAGILASSLAACGGAVEPTSEGEVSAWSQLLTCSGGAAVVQADPTGRVELVIREPEAVRALGSRVDRAVNARGEVTVAGATDRPIARPEELAGFLDDTGRFDVTPASDGSRVTRVVAAVRRESADVLAVSFTEQTTKQVCTGSVEARFCRNGAWVDLTDERELASWTFAGCR